MNAEAGESMLSPQERELVRQMAIQQAQAEKAQMARDAQLGISLRFVKQWDIQRDLSPFGYSDWLSDDDARKI